MKPTIHEIAQRVMSDTRYQNPRVQDDFVALLGHIGALQQIADTAEQADGLRALCNRLETLQANRPEPQFWAVAWLDAEGEEQREFFPADQRHAAETLYDRLDATGVHTIEMSQTFLTKEKKEN
ncbi:hypothetical protein [Arthrobacter pityocampae]|uniref:hypothetical protein n=1 Tax=Arthrobacter pityocampae TaxID=547334 RepID=UPI003735396D